MGRVLGWWCIRDCRAEAGGGDHGVAAAVDGEDDGVDTAVDEDDRENGGVTWDRHRHQEEVVGRDSRGTSAWDEAVDCGGEDDRHRRSAGVDDKASDGDE